MKTLILSIAILSITISAHCQIVNIPDANFKAYLVGESTINTNLDAEIQVTEANSFTGNMIITSLGIADLTGLEEFTKITYFSAANNLLTDVDLTANTMLISVGLSYNFGLSSVDVSTCTALIGFICTNTLLGTLDLSNNPNLASLTLQSNCLTFLDLRSGNNINISGSNYNVTGNKLACISVDNAAWSLLAWTNVDPGTVYNNDCSLGINTIGEMPIKNSEQPIFTIDGREVTPKEQLKGLYIVGGKLKYFQ